MLALGKARWWVNGTSLSYFCNFFWVYFKIIFFKKSQQIHSYFVPSFVFEAGSWKPSDFSCDSHVHWYKDWFQTENCVVWVHVHTHAHECMLGPVILIYLSVLRWKGNHLWLFQLIICQGKKRVYFCILS